MALESTELRMPDSIVTPVDLGRLDRELRAVDDFATQSSLRKAGQQPALPKTSNSLEELAKLYDANLLIEEDRRKLTTMLKKVREQAPVIHMSFATDPPPAFLAKVITWLRDEIHPQVLLGVGLQPDIAAGCIVRTPNKYYDFSLRKFFEQKHQLLISQLSPEKG